MKTKFTRYRVWAPWEMEDEGGWCYGRSAQEAADEAFLEVIDISEPPPHIDLHCRADGSITVETVRVYPAAQRPFVPAFQQAELSL